MKLALSAIALVQLAGAAALGAENVLSAEEKEAGWILLFDGKSLDGWLTNNREPSQTPVHEGALDPHGSGGYMLIHS